jgi:hypothetical protein
VSCINRESFSVNSNLIIELVSFNFYLQINFRFSIELNFADNLNEIYKFTFILSIFVRFRVYSLFNKRFSSVLNIPSTDS